MKSRRQQTVLGVDIICYRCKDNVPHYVAILLEGEKVKLKYDDITLHGLTRLLWEVRPNILAIDNVLELGGDERKFTKFVKMMPSDVKIIQVTLWPDGLIDLKEAARRAGIDVGYGKLSPSKTAYISALLASKGYGTEIKLYEEKTRIIISKAASIGPGGMSQNRYKRRIRVSILNLTRKIKEALDKHGIDYDLTFRKSGGGLESSVFTVYVPREKLYGIVKPLESPYVRIEIIPVFKPKLDFLTILKHEEKSRPIIVGIDPGISVGIAIINLDGVPIAVTSGRNIDRADMADYILSHGVPVLIATDVTPIPDTIKKLASMFNTTVHAPEQSLTIEEKRKIIEEVTKRYPWIKITDNHQRDALAAAIRAYRSFESKFKQIDAYLSKIGLDISVENVKVKVLKGKTITEAVEEEIARIYGYEEVEEERKTDHQVKQKVVDIEKYREEISKLVKEKEVLKEKLRRVEEEKERLEREINILKTSWSKEVAVDREVANLKDEVRRLSEILKRLENENNELRNRLKKVEKTLISIIKGELIPLKKINMLTEDALRKLEKHFGIKENDIIFIENPGFYMVDAVRVLKDKKILALVVKDANEGKGLQDVAKRNLIPVLDANEYVVDTLFDIPLAKPSIINDALFLKRRVKEERARIEKSRLLSIIEEYKKMRIKQYSHELK